MLLLFLPTFLIKLRCRLSNKISKVEERSKNMIYKFSVLTISNYKAKDKISEESVNETNIRIHKTNSLKKVKEIIKIINKSKEIVKDINSKFFLTVASKIEYKKVNFYVYNYKSKTFTKFKSIEDFEENYLKLPF